MKRFNAEWDNVDRPCAVTRYHPDGKPYDVLAGFVRTQRMIDEGKPELACIPGW